LVRGAQIGLTIALAIGVPIALVALVLMIIDLPALAVPLWIGSIVLSVAAFIPAALIATFVAEPPRSGSRRSRFTMGRSIPRCWAPRPSPAAKSARSIAR